MKRRRYDSDSEGDEGNVAPTTAAQPPQPSSSTAAVPERQQQQQPASFFGGGTLFSKGRRTQLASELASRVEHGDLGLEATTSAHDGAASFSSPYQHQRRPNGSDSLHFAPHLLAAAASHQQNRPIDLLERLNEDSAISPSGVRNSTSKGIHHHTAVYDDPLKASVGEILPIASTNTSLNNSFSSAPLVPQSIAAATSAANGVGMTTSVPPVAATSSAPQTPAIPTVPVGLTSIRAYITSGFRPQMNCRIQDDETGRSGVWLPPSTVHGSAGGGAGGAGGAANGGALEGKGGAADSTITTAASAKDTSATSASTLLTVKPLASDRAQPGLFKTIASTGPIPIEVLRSLKMPPSSQANSGNGAKASGGEDDVGADGGKDARNGRGKRDRDSADGSSRGGRGGGRGGRGRGGASFDSNGFPAATAPSYGNYNRFADEVPLEIAKHVDAGGGGLQHPYFNTYCSTILSKLTLNIDAGVPTLASTLTAESAKLPTSPTSGTAQPDFSNAAMMALIANHGVASLDPAIPSAGAGGGLVGGSGASEAAAPSTADNVRPALTVLSHSLTTRDVFAVYCGGTATTTARPRRRADDANSSAAEGVKEDGSLLAGASTKPHTYTINDPLSRDQMATVLRSGWRWDGIVRGNARILAKYSAAMMD